MSKFWRKADDFAFMTIIIGPATIIFGLIIIIGLIKGCVRNDIDPMDNSINKSREIVTHLHVVDSTKNGFRVVYATTNAVTEERLLEIRSRKAILDAFGRLQHDAPLHWGGSLMDADICDFALFALKYNVDKDITIHNIFVDGVEKMELYVQPNPNMPGCATWMNFGTKQGVQYIDATDINFRIPAGEKIYRYWKASNLHEYSHTDERFSHFLEKDRQR